MNVLITAPHSKCVIKNLKDEHYCDYLAKKSAIYISKSFDELHVKNIVVVADKNRIELDYNRISNRRTKWRQFIRDVINKNQTISLLLDIHSYPNHHTSFGWVSQKIIPEVVILDSYTSDQYFLDKKTSTDFNDYLIENNILSKLLQGGDNDIIIEARQKFNIPSVLIEFNENLSNKRLKYITKVIVNYFKVYLLF